MNGELAELIEPVVKRLGFELADLEVRLGGRHGLVRLFIDRPRGVTLDDCERVSLAVSALLDVEDPVPGRYDLEVSSPGLNRKLTKPKHFTRFVGEFVKVEMRFPIEGRKRFRGQLKGANGGNIEVDVDGVSYSLPLATIDTARLIPGELP